MGSSAFTLIYDFLHDATAAPAHLPWVYASLQSLSTLRVGDPIASSISAIQTTLRNIDPSYEWSPYPGASKTYQPGLGALAQASQTPEIMRSSLLMPMPSSQWGLSQTDGPETGKSGGSNEDLLDFTQSDMGWNLDFSTMDLEAFFSVNQSADAQL